MRKIDHSTALKTQRIRRKWHEYQKKHHAIYMGFKNRGRLDLYRLIKAKVQFKKTPIYEYEMVKPKRIPFWKLLIKRIKVLLSNVNYKMRYLLGRH